MLPSYCYCYYCYVTVQIVTVHREHRTLTLTLTLCYSDDATIFTYVAVLCRNQILFRRVFQAHHRDAELPLRGGLICAM